jgi:alpha-ribazole phosphatase
MRVDFIRHGKTEGNLEMRYVGRTDESLSFSGIAELMKNDYPPCGVLITSPMKRCIQTAELLYPDKAPIICEELRECNFGAFEGRNYIELSTDSRYQKWIDSGGVSAFPEGEDPADFKERCIAGFLASMAKVPEGSSATFVVHGGTIMTILSELFGGDFFDYQVGNGMGYSFVLSPDGTFSGLSSRSFAR